MFNLSITRAATRRFAIAAALSLFAGPVVAQGAAPDISGMWRLAGPFQPAMRTVDGKLPPMKPEARKLYLQRIADRRAGKPGDGVDICLRPGTPRIMWMDRPFLILQTPTKITFVHEYQHVLRHIYLNENLPGPDDLEMLYGGTSAGRWVGDTLVVDTAGFNDKTRLDQAGLPNSPDMKVTERFRLIGGKLLEDRVTIDDLANYTHPWSARITFRRAPGVELKEDVCAEKLLDPALRKPER
jgi:hypothetical protein